MIFNGLGGLGAAESPQKTTAKASSQNPKNIINHYIFFMILQTQPRRRASKSNEAHMIENPLKHLIIFSFSILFGSENQPQGLAKAGPKTQPKTHPHYQRKAYKTGCFLCFL
jgi:hypothetical protein